MRERLTRSFVTEHLRSGLLGALVTTYDLSLEYSDLFEEDDFATFKDMVDVLCDLVDEEEL